MSDFNGTVAITVGFDNRHQPGFRLCDAVQLSDVMGNGLQIDFSPNQRSIQIYTSAFRFKISGPTD